MSVLEGGWGREGGMTKSATQGHDTRGGVGGGAEKGS